MDVRTICLGMLTLGDHSGYEIKKMFEDGSVGSVTGVSFGAIYPALNRLTEEGLVSCRSETQDKRPDKKVYSITPAGRAVFQSALLDPIGEDRFRSPFVFFMFFADQMPPDRIQALIDDRIAFFVRKREQVSSWLSQASTPAQRFIIGLGLSTFDAEIAYLKTHRDALIGAAKAVALPSPPPQSFHSALAAETATGVAS
jgi:PadR family transcriptional regulator, regulatory protein AphA